MQLRDDALDRTSSTHRGRSSRLRAAVDYARGGRRSGSGELIAGIDWGAGRVSSADSTSTSESGTLGRKAPAPRHAQTHGQAQSGGHSVSSEGRSPGAETAGTLSVLEGPMSASAPSTDENTRPKASRRVTTRRARYRARTRPRPAGSRGDLTGRCFLRGIELLLPGGGVAATPGRAMAQARPPAHSSLSPTDSDDSYRVHS